jgi:hypothetical protein
MKSAADVRQALWHELEEVLDGGARGFLGQIILHCSEGRVIKYEVRETRHPKSEKD